MAGTQLEGRHLLFAELNNPKHALSKMNLTLMELSMFHLCF